VSANPGKKSGLIQLQTDPVGLAHFRGRDASGEQANIQQHRSFGKRESNRVIDKSPRLV
jgi:hypothetical protein